MALSDSYCVSDDLRDVFPQVNEFDTKTPIFSWTRGIINFHDTSMDIYYAANSGVVNNLFINGAKIDKITFNTTATTTLAENLTQSIGEVGDTDFDVVNGSDFSVGDIIKINNEYMKVQTVSSNTLGLSAALGRGLFGTSAQYHTSGTNVYMIVDSSADLPDATSAGITQNSFFYDPDLDVCMLVGDDLTTNDPNDSLIESGEDWKTHKTDIIKKASRYFDSRVDSTISRDQFKDKNGEYDYLVVRTTALIACSFLISAHTPTSDMLEQIKEEYNFNIDLINTGKAKLSHQISGDSSQGIVREVLSPQDANPLYLVDTRGNYTGTYDLIKVIITTAGAIGVGKFDVYVKDSDGLKNNQSITAEKITGDYQSIGHGLYIRFQGKNSSSEADANDEWEIEVFGRGEELADVGINSVRSVGMTRGGYGVWQ